MSDSNSPTLIEKLTSQIREEQRRYRNALISNKEFWELKQIKNNINKLQTTLQRLLNNLRGYGSKNSQDLKNL